MAEKVKMKKATINFISDVLKQEVELRKNRMLDCIGNKLPNMNERIKQYQEVYEIEQDYFEWAYEQEN